MKYRTGWCLLLAGVLSSATVLAKPPHAEEGTDGGRKGLPPGLQKKVARGEPLPPGWERKLQVGEPLEADLYQRARPLSDALLATLPAGPAGTVTVRLEGKAVRLYEASREILDVFEIKALP